MPQREVIHRRDCAAVASPQPRARLVDFVVKAVRVLHPALDGHVKRFGGFGLRVLAFNIIELDAELPVRIFRATEKGETPLPSLVTT